MISLSIIIPHYNSSDMLLKLLNSIPAKKEIQILVIDDHSNEGEKRKLKEIENTSIHENILFLENDEGKKGAGSSRNVGLRKAIGKWVLFADADDFFVDGFYEIIQKHFNSDFDMVFFKPTSVELDTGNISDRHKKFVARVDDYSKTGTRKSELTLRYATVVPWSKLIRRRVIKENNIMFENVISSNDVMFSAELGRCIKSFGISNDTIYCVTRSSGSLTTSLNDEIFDTRLAVFIRYYKYLEKNLSEEDFNTIDITGQGQIYNSLNYGINKVYKVFRALRKNKVRVISKKMYNPIWFIKRFSIVYSQRKKTQRFYKKV